MTGSPEDEEAVTLKSASPGCFVRNYRKGESLGSFTENLHVEGLTAGSREVRITRLLKSDSYSSFRDRFE